MADAPLPTTEFPTGDADATGRAAPAVTPYLPTLAALVEAAGPEATDAVRQTAAGLAQHVDALTARCARLADRERALQEELQLTWRRLDAAESAQRAETARRTECEAQAASLADELAEARRVIAARDEGIAWLRGDLERRDAVHRHQIMVLRSLLGWPAWPPADPTAPPEDAARGLAGSWPTAAPAEPVAEPQSGGTS